MELIPDDIDFKEYMQEPEFNRIRSATEFEKDVIKLFYPDPNTPIPPGPLWQKTNGKMQFRPGEVSLWAGINGHGKSMFLSQIVLDMLYKKNKVLIISLEMQPAIQMQRMCRQASGTEVPNLEFIGKFHKKTDGLLWMYDQHGQLDWRKAIAVCRYANENFGINHFVIDSLMKCVKGEDDYNGQKDFLNELCGFAMVRGVHIHLVHHVRKGDTNKETVPGKFDIKGSGGISDQVDNIYIVWRNKKAEDDMSKGNYDGSPTALIKCEKSRHGNWEGTLGFWFEPQSLQYLENPASPAVRYDMPGI